MRVRSNSEISDFADRLAHELANIQTGISGYLARLQDYADIDETGRITFDDTQRALARNAALIARLKAVAGHPGTGIRPQDPNRLTVEIAAEIRRTLPGDIHLRLHLGHDISPLTMDPGRYRLALAEMVANAAEAMQGKGTVHIELSHVAAESGGDYVRVAVGDTGHGIAPDLARQVGTPLRTTKAYPHRGWGLAVCAAFCRQAGGFMEIDSAPGQGTCAALFLPCGMADQDA